ncbi:zinc ribbon domain-containing protein [Vibrio sp. MMG022]|uniref:zinc ribbon domain-containing protein n=1 Tax=Vibrio sp. MMG023 TaxID=2909979 RepID=UPI001F1BF5CB|nr:zinc ribbon domain-containing protein [Vibrio sp. MMG023]MCF6454449.1 zinc ribbon domain-containing protein [Vibrio sp. MMG023]
MQPNICPTCDIELEWIGQYHCNQCESDYKKVGFCPDCDAELEKLQACGTANYFCNSCNELKSKSRVRFEFQKVS